MSAEPISTMELSAFIDGELELGRQLAIEGRLAIDPSLRAEVEALRELSSALRGRADYHPATPALLSRLQWPEAEAVDAARPLPVAGVAPRADGVAGAPGLRPGAGSRAGSGLGPDPGWRRWFQWRPFVPAFALAAAAMWALNLALLAPPRDAQMLQEVIASHVRSTVGQKLIDVASSDQHVVKPWLSSRLDYSPPVADAPVPGAVFLGGRIDYLDGRPVAALVYRQRQHLIDAYIWPTGATDSHLRSLSQRGFNTVHWVQNGMQFWVVSDINRDELGGIAQAISKADAVR